MNETHLTKFLNYFFVLKHGYDERRISMYGSTKPPTKSIQVIWEFRVFGDRKNFLYKFWYKKMMIRARNIFVMVKIAIFF